MQNMKERRVAVTYKLPASLVQKIAERARADKRTKTAVVDIAISAYLEAPCETK